MERRVAGDLLPMGMGALAVCSPNDADYGRNNNNETQQQDKGRHVKKNKAVLLWKHEPGAF